MSSDSNNQLKTVLNLLNELDRSINFEVYIPSLQKNISFKQLTTEQLKRILKTIIDVPLYNTEFILTINSIIKENCLAQDLDVNNLTVLDKQIILFKTRIESVSSSYTFNINDEQFEVSLSEKLTNFLNKQINFEPETFTNNSYSVICTLPTLLTEDNLEKELHKNVTFSINTPEELRNAIGETFINEITKFINTIIINTTPFDLSAYSFKDRVKVIEKLPISLIGDVIKYIEKYRNYVKELYSFEITTNNGVTVEKEILQDASFFNS